MRSRWLRFWKVSGTPDSNLNKYRFHGGNASGVWGQSYINRGRPFRRWLKRCLWEGEMRKIHKALQVLFGSINLSNKSCRTPSSQTELMVKNRVWSLTCWDAVLCYSTEVGITTGKELFANKYLILTLWVIHMSSGQTIHRSHSFKVSLVQRKRGTFANFLGLKNSFCVDLKEKEGKTKGIFTRVSYQTKNMCQWICEGYLSDLRCRFITNTPSVLTWRTMWHKSEETSV